MNQRIAMVAGMKLVEARRKPALRQVFRAEAMSFAGLIPLIEISANISKPVTAAVVVSAVCRTETTRIPPRS
jgi:hypothetical protein